MKDLKVVRLGVFVLLASAQALISEAGVVTLQWDAPTDAATSGYVVLYGTASRTYSRQLNVGNATSWTIAELTDGGTYYFAVKAYDASGAFSELSDEVVGTVPSAGNASVTALLLTSNVPPPQAFGTSVQWHATPTGGVPPHQFQWAVYGPGGWSMGPWTTAATSSWTPSSAGDYVIRVAVRSAGSNNEGGELAQSVPFVVTAPLVARVASVSIAASLPAPQTLGKTVVFTGTAGGGTGLYQYRWWISDGVTWTAATDWTNENAWSWTPSVANDKYIIRVGVRTLGATLVASEASASVPFPIKRAPKGRVK